MALFGGPGKQGASTSASGSSSPNFKAAQFVNALSVYKPAFGPVTENEPESAGANDIIELGADGSIDESLVEDIEEFDVSHGRNGAAPRFETATPVNSPPRGNTNATNGVSSPPRLTQVDSTASSNASTIAASESYDELMSKF